MRFQAAPVLRDWLRMAQDRGRTAGRIARAVRQHSRKQLPSSMPAGESRLRHVWAAVRAGPRRRSVARISTAG